VPCLFEKTASRILFGLTQRMQNRTVHAHPAE
jgi:hypothetical protein